MRRTVYFTPSTAPSPEILTRAEFDVLKLIVAGNTNREIAEKFNLSVRTIEAHRAHIMNKLKLKNGVELVLYALRFGFINIDGVLQDKHYWQIL